MNHYKNLEDKIRGKKAIVGIVGLGYVGEAVALSSANAGYTSLGFDINKEKIESINQKKIKNLSALSNMSKLKKCDVICICVPTPIDNQKKPILKFLETALSTVKKYLTPGKLIILESSVAVGTTRNLALPLLHQSRLKHGLDFFLAFSPERIDPGNKTYTLKTIPKVVSGISARACNLAVKFYKNIADTVIPVSSTEIAEMSKILENVFRLVNISLVNELSVYAKALGIDMWKVIQAASTKPFGFLPHFPGPGVGGECIPVVPYYLLDDAKKRNLDLKMVKAATDINEERTKQVVNRAINILNHGRAKKNQRALIIGISYKPESADIRQSPAIIVWKQLEKKGIRVCYHDPYVKQVNGTESVSISKKQLEKQNLIIITTFHHAVNYKKIVESKTPILDTVNALSVFKSPYIIPF